MLLKQSKINLQDGFSGCSQAIILLCIKRHEISETNTWHKLTLRTSSSEDLHSTDSEMSVTALFSSMETTLMGTATVFPVRIAVFRISVSCTQNKAQHHSETAKEISKRLASALQLDLHSRKMQ